MPLKINVNGPGGLNLTVIGDASWSVRDVKQKVEAEKGVPVHAQILSAGTQRLRDGDLLSSVIKPYDSQVSLTMRKRNADQLHWLKLLQDQDGPARLEQAPDFIRSDYELMLVAAGRSADTLKHVHQHLLSSRDFILAAARQNSDVLNWASKEMWADGDFVLETLQYSWRWLQSASEELRSDRDFVLRATAQNRWALQCASENLRSDEQFVALCMESGRREYIMDHMKEDGRSLCRARGLRNDSEVVKAAVSSKGTALEYASSDLQADRSIVMEAVKNDPMALQWAADELKVDREIVAAALEKDDRAMKFVPPELMTDKLVRGYASTAKRPPVMTGGTATDMASRPSTSLALAKANVTEITLSRSSSQTKRLASTNGRPARSKTPLGSRAPSPSRVPPTSYR